ncbi:MAG TPA: AMP-binding protein [Gemmataceae bacterium]|nr:AMP-binding protein [Gemmataceae bacterium]
MANHFLRELHTAFADRANHAALTHRGRTYSFGELEALAQRCASWLRTLGVSPGDRVALCTPNKLPFLVAHLGTLYAGAVSLPLNPRFTREELRFFLADSGARVAVAGPDQYALLEGLQPELPELRCVVADAGVLDAPNAPYIEPAIAADDPCLILYSSGTTGWPKGIVHTHANTANALRCLARSWHFSPGDVVANVLPLFHIHGLSIATHLTLLSGSHLLLEDNFDPVGTLPVIGKSTVFMAVPTIYYKFLEQPAFRTAAKSWSQVRLFTCGSAPIRPEVLPELETILGRPIINRYGMTETFVITSLPRGGPWPQGSVGVPLDGVELRLTDVQDNVGTVSLRGPNLFREYWGKPEASRAAFRTGWFDTGDLGTLDAAGFLTLVGRKHDLIITSGYNVYPQVVERVLNDCPGVRESAVVGVADRRRGERVVAFVVKGDDSLNERRVLDHCGDRLVDYQRPSAVVFVESLPRNAMGKVLRRELQKKADPH